ncbi:ABC transporter permease [Spiroplasma corruscae]|uniref:ABC transporter permease n=1 Tax=Spiroplasma corruscae TaxID=216934 RepID=A0A222EPV7_9MOLU|nr:ABC transporter permease [Spiroplasma corruscae]ASP28557.1 ABC transporter permease [Spiroplasma corruscae]
MIKKKTKKADNDLNFDSSISFFKNNDNSIDEQSDQIESEESELGFKNKKTKKLRKKSLNSLIIKSGVKQMSKSFASIFFIYLLVVIASSLCFILSLFYDRVDSNLNNLSAKSNLRDFIVDVDQNDKISFNQKELIGGEKILDYSNNDLYQQYLINTLSRKGKFYDENNNVINGNNYFDWSRTESRLFNTVSLNNKDLTTRVITKTGLISSTINDDFEEVVNENNSVDKLVLYESIYKNNQVFSENVNEASKQVVLQYNFAKKNNIELNDIVRFNSDNYGKSFIVKNDQDDLTFGKKNNDINDPINGIDQSKYSDQSWFQVVGFGTSIDFMYSYKNRENPIPNINTEVNAYVSPKVFGLSRVDISKTMSLYSYNPNDSILKAASESDREVSFSCKFFDINNYSEQLIQSLNNEYLRFGNISQKSKKVLYAINDSTYKYFNRISIYNNILFIFKFVSYFFVFLIVAIIIFIVTQFIKRELKDSEKKIGTFKAMGCSKSKLTNFFWILPTLIVFLAVFTSYIAVIFTQNYVLKIATNYLNVNIGNMSFIQFYVFPIMFIFIILIYLICQINTLKYLRRDASSLLFGVTSKPHSRFLYAYKALYTYSKFNKKLHSALFSSSFKKVMATSTVIFISSILLSFLSIVPFVIAQNKQEAFSGLDYKNIIEYNQPVSNNPYTFLKTYNPNKINDYNYNENNKVINDYSEALGNQTSYYTSSPVSKNSNGNLDYDSNTIINDLITGDISRNFYSYNVPVVDQNVKNPQKLLQEIAKLGYSDWKNYSIDYLKLLNKMDISVFTNNETSIKSSSGYQAALNILNRWPDYYNLLTKIEQYYIDYSGGVNSGDTLSNLKKIFNELQLFYSKYNTNLQLSNKNNYYNEKYELNLDNIKKIDFKTLIFNSTNSVYNVKNPNPFSLMVNNEDLALSVENSYKDFNESFKENKLYYDDQEIRSLITEDLDSSTLKKLNTFILIWFWINYANKLGDSIFQSFYSNEPSEVQDNIKNALNKNEDYNFSFNLIPYNKENEETGTMLNGTYSLNNKTYNLKIYGLNPDSTALDMNDANGDNVKSNLFKKINPSFGNAIPIVINNSLAKKLNLDIGNSLYGIKVSKSELVGYKQINSGDGEMSNLKKTIGLDQVKTGLNTFSSDSSNTNKFFSEYKKNYYSIAKDNIGWSNGSDLSNNIAYVCIESSKECLEKDKFDFAVSNISNINDPSKIQQASWNSKISVEKTETNQNFVVVGVQGSYGEPKAWVSNENANRVLGYDEVQKYFFNNYFISEWSNKNYLKSFFNQELFGDFTVEQWESFIDFFNQIVQGWLSDNPKYNSNAKNPFDDFIETFIKLSDDYHDTNGYKKFSSILYTIFQNEYPTFNYKYKKNNIINDNTFSSSKTQEFGDYSTIGLYGKTEIDPNSKSYIFNDGFIKNNILNNQDVEIQKDFLNNVTELLNGLIIIITVIVFSMSFIIIFISSVYIINENSKFIATLKTLGYTNRYLVGQVFMIYFTPILLSVFIGFGTCWGVLKYLFNYLSTNSSSVIPYLFNYQSPLIVFSVIFAIYLFSIYVAQKALSKINPSEVLGDQ